MLRNVAVHPAGGFVVVVAVVGGALVGGRDVVDDVGGDEVGGREVGGDEVGGDEVGGRVVGVVGAVVGPSARVGVCQSLHSARLPGFRLEILNVPAPLPVFSRNFWMCCCKGVRHSGRTAQWV